MGKRHTLGPVFETALQRDSWASIESGEAGKGCSLVSSTLSQIPYPKPSYAWYLVAVLLAAGITAYLDRYLISLFVQPIKHDLSLSDTQISMLQGLAFALFFVVFGLPLGHLVDRGKRRMVLALAIAIWSATTFACGLATNFTELFIARAGVGIGEACLAPAAYSLIADAFAPSGRGKAMGVYNITNYLGAGASLLIGGLIIWLFSGASYANVIFFGPVATWKLAFFLVSIPGFLLSLLMLSTREIPRQQGATTLLTGHKLTAFAEFFSFLVANGRAFFFVYFVAVMTAIVGLTVTLWAATLLIRNFGISPSQAGLFLGPATALGGTAGCLCSGILSDWLIRRKFASGRFFVPLCALPIVLVALAAIGVSDTGVSVVIAIGALFFGSGLGVASTPPTIQDITPNRFRGRAVALYFIFSTLSGMGIAPTLIAVVMDKVFHDPAALRSSLLLVLIPCTLMGLLACLLGQRAYATALRKQRI